MPMNETSIISRVDRSEHELHRHLGRVLGVLGDALIGVVDPAVDEVELVMPPVLEPTR